MFLHARLPQILMCVICKDPEKAESATGNIPISGWITQLARGKTLPALELTFNSGYELQLL